ncbi:MAG: maleylpyruvate isomerase N-terminal domain-containing protein, partial [Rhodospirillaceae bacterium]|nr:maleylpyruvate isomerase N-terminal domain-containing protein [Rhodospirillaceae bacterium]
MLAEAADFKAECDALHALLQGRDDADFEHKTQFKDWTVDDVIAHLHMWNHAVNLSVTDETGFDAFVQAFLDAGRRHFPYTHEWSGGLKGQ